MKRILAVTLFTLLGVLVLLAFAAPLATPTNAQCGRLLDCKPDPKQPAEPAQPRDPKEPNPDRPSGNANPTGVSIPLPVVTPEITVVAIPLPVVTPDTTSSTVPSGPSPEPSVSPEPSRVAIPAPTTAPVVIITPPPVVVVSFPTTVVLNEYRAKGKDAENEWIEIYNTGDTQVDLSGWRVAHTANGGGAYILPQGTTIAARGFLVLTRQQTGLALDLKNDDVQLLYPTGAFADTTRHAALRENQVYARSTDGAGLWLADCKPTPNTANCPAVVGASNYFRDHIASPSLVGDLNVVALITNFLLALILALAMGFFGNMLNDVLESHEPEIAAWFAPLRPIINSARDAATRFDQQFETWRIGIVGWSIKLAFMLALYGIVFAYLDPSFDITSINGWFLVAGLALSAGVIGIIDDVAQYIYLRANGLKGTIRLHGGNLTLSIVSALFSRFSGVTPGFLFGNPAGLEDVDDPKFEVPSHLIAMGAMGVAALFAWLISPVFSDDSWIHTTLLLIFALGIHSLFIEMLPVKYLHGKGIFQYNRWLWVAMFAVITTIFFQTMLNPDGDFVRAFQQTNMVVLSLIVIGFCLSSVGLWYFFQQRAKAQAQG